MSWIVDAKRGNVNLVLHQDGQTAGMEAWHQRRFFGAVAFILCQIGFSNTASPHIQFPKPPHDHFSVTKGEFAG